MASRCSIWSRRLLQTRCNNEPVQRAKRLDTTFARTERRGTAPCWLPCPVRSPAARRPRAGCAPTDPPSATLVGCQCRATATVFELRIRTGRSLQAVSEGAYERGGCQVEHLDLHERLALHDALRALPQRRRRQCLPAGGRPLLDALPCPNRLILGRLLLLRTTASSVDSIETSGRAAQLTGTGELQQHKKLRCKTRCRSSVPRRSAPNGADRSVEKGAPGR